MVLHAAQVKIPARFSLQLEKKKKKNAVRDLFFTRRQIRHESYDSCIAGDVALILPLFELS
jgi:hypothetical protein